MGTFGGVELDDLVLRTERLELRPWRPGDAERIFRVLQDARMHAYLPLPDPYTRDEATAFIGETASQARINGSALVCAMERRRDGTVVGSCSLGLGRHPEIGYWVATDAQGHGYAAEATRALAGWGFTTGLHRITIRCDTRNVASARTALAAGFAFEGISRAGFASDSRRAQAGQHLADLARFARLASDPGDPVPPRLPPFPREGVSDGVLRLRTSVAPDAAAMARWDDEQARRWGFDRTGPSDERLRASAADAGLHWLVSRIGGQLTMVDEATGAPAGGLGVRLTGPPGVCMLGYVVDPAFRGRGFTTRALRLFSDWAFEAAGVARIELGARVENIASQQSARNAGFVPDGIAVGRLRDVDGGYGDEARFVLRNPAVALVSRISS